MVEVARPRPRVVDWLFTLPFLVVFGAILGVFDVAQRIARLFGPRPHEIVVGLLQTSLIGAFRICGTRIEVERSPKVTPRTAYVVIANHQSMFDIPIIGAYLFTNYPKYVSKRSLARWIPSISYNLRRGGNAIIDRADRDQAVVAIRELGTTAALRGVSPVIFPEGTRARHGSLGAFKPAGTVALLEAAPHLPVVPLAIDGSWRLLRFNLLPVPFGVRIRLRIGDPIARTPKQTTEDLLEAARAHIERALSDWRSS